MVTRIIGLLLPGLPLLAVAGCSALEDITFASAGVDYWLPALEGDVEFDSAGLGTNTIDVDDTLDLEDEETFNFHGAVQLGNITADVSFFQFHFTGDNQVSEDVNFGGQTFTVGTRVMTDVDVRFASGKAKVGLLGLGPVAAGVIVGLNYLEIDAELSAAPISASQELEAPFPVVGVVATVNQSLGDYFGIFAEAEVSGLAIDAYDLRGNFLDVVGRGGIKLSLFRIGAGYRHMQVDFEDVNDDFRWDFRLSGPFVFAEAAF